MEHISNQLTVASKQEIVPYSNELKLSLLPEEQQILDHKYKSKPFGVMTTDEIFVAVHVLLTKLHVITGWNVPEKDEMLNILIDQMAKKFTESYQNVNADEMEYAFRNNHGVKDWGKNINLNLLDEIMTPYLNKRKELSRIEEEKKSKLIALPPPEISDDEFIDTIEKLYLDSNKNWRLIPVLAYEILVRQGKINLDKDDKTLIKMIIDEQFEEVDEPVKKDLCKQYSVSIYFNEKK